MSKSSTIWANGKPIGHIRGDTFHKNVRSSAHFLQKPPAICLDAKSLLDAQHAGAQWVEIHDTDTGRTYRAAVATVWQHGKRIDRGHGKQIALALGKWECDNPQQTHLQMGFAL